eukprot:10555968-Prorocentrum_lima.AAC.1
MFWDKIGPCISLCGLLPPGLFLLQHAVQADPLSGYEAGVWLARGLEPKWCTSDLVSVLS